MPHCAAPSGIAASGVQTCRLLKSVMCATSLSGAIIRASECQAVGCLPSGDVETGKSLLRDYVNATNGFELWATGYRRPAEV